MVMTDSVPILEDFFTCWTTMKDAANIVGRDHSTIRYWADNGKIRSFNLGSSNVRVVNIKEVQEYSEQANRLDMSKRSRKRGK